MWTAERFRSAGVAFFFPPGAPAYVQGPSDQEALREALVAELQRRKTHFLSHAPMQNRDSMQRYALPGVMPRRSDSCDLCGDAMPEGRGGFCALCILALDRAGAER